MLLEKFNFLPLKYQQLLQLVLIFIRGELYLRKYVKDTNFELIVFRIWDFNKTNEPLESVKQHTEFAYGLDWNPLRKNQLADCGWDSLVHVFTPGCLDST